MKIGILTYYGVHNHGALLQAFALQNVLESFGNSVEFLTFRRNYDNIPSGNEKKYQIGISSIPFFIDYLNENGIGTFKYNYMKRKKLNSFRNEKLKLGKRYSDCEVDSICIGSDEVFAIDVGINPFFYGHCLKNKNVFSYAGSFGQTTLKDIYNAGCDNLISSGLNSMKSIGVRDINSYQIAEKLSGKKPELLCDPVLLYGYKSEIENITHSNNSKPYILIYSYDKNMNKPNEISAIRSFAKSKGLKIYSVGYYHKWCDKNIAVSPIELLDWFKNAEFVITDTFHGSVISIITNSPFAAFVRNNANKLVFLLEQHGISDRIIKDFSGLNEIYGKKIDYSAVNQKVEENREKARNFLKKALAEK